MRVRITGPSLSDGEGHRFAGGSVVDVDDATAEGWIANGFAAEAPPADESEHEGAPRKATRQRKPRTATAPRPED